jgi:glycosyltransferase involved in cell wall biosynthesis
MKIALLSYSDTGGGAYIAAFRLLRGLIELNPECRMIVKRKYTNSENVELSINPRFLLADKFINYIIRKIKKSIYNVAYEVINFGIFHNTNEKFLSERLKNYDIINVHWIGNETVNIGLLSKINKPVVITMHDLWWIDGLFHYPPVDHETARIREKWYVRKLNEITLAKKRDFLLAIKPDIICPSSWLAEQVKNCNLIAEKRIHVIHNPFDFSKWPQRRDSKFYENSDCVLKILFISADLNDKRKGAFLLHEVLKSFKAKYTGMINISLVGTNTHSLATQLKSVDGIEINPINFVDDSDRLAEIYNEHDLLLHLALIDNLPNTCVEAVSVGLPVCGINLGGISDITFGGKAGFLASSANVQEIADNIIPTVLLGNSRVKRCHIRKIAIERFSSTAVTKQYQEVFTKKINDA